MRRKIVYTLKILVILSLLIPTIPLLETNIVNAASASTGAYYYSVSNSLISDFNAHGLGLGKVNRQKVVTGNYSQIKFDRIAAMSEEGFAPIESIITVERRDEANNVIQTLSGKAMAFADLAKQADAGYIMVDDVELVNWIKVLNGNPNYVRSKIYPYRVSDITKGFVYNAYNLAEVAYHSGGQGIENGDGLVETRNSDNDWWESHGKFIATPRPTAKLIAKDSSGTEKYVFKANETIHLFGSVTDYSIYDKGSTPVNIAIFNANNNSEYEDQPGQATLQKAAPLTVGTNIYKGTFVATDQHGRTTQRSTDTGNSTPEEVLISVEPGVCTPLTGTLKVSGKSDKAITSGGAEALPSGVNTITLVFPQAGTLKVDGVTAGTGTTFSNLLIGTSTVVNFIPFNATYCSWTKTFTSSGGGGGTEPPGGNSCDLTMGVQTYTGSGKGEIKTDMPADPDTAFSLAYDTDTIMLTYKGDETGVFTLNGSELPSTTGKDALVLNFPKSRDTVFTLKFTTDDGRECWIKKFILLPRPGDGYDCPTFEIVSSGNVNGFINSGDSIARGLNSSLQIRAWFKHPDTGDPDHIPVFWRITRPDGTVATFKWDLNDRDRLTLQTASLLVLPETNAGSNNISFNQVGTYTIEAYWDSLSLNDPYKTWTEDDCEWKIYVNVSICENTRLSVLDDGRGAHANRNPDTGDYTLELSQNVASHPLKFTSKIGSTDTPSNWVLKKSDRATPIHTASNVSTFEYTITEVGDYVLTSTVRSGGETCVTTLYIAFKNSCDDLEVVAKVNNSSVWTTGKGTQADPYVVPITLGQDNRFTLSLKMNGELLTRDYAWYLYRNGVFQYWNKVTNFSHTIPNGSAEYSVRVSEQIDGLDCEKWIVFKVPSPEDPPPGDPGVRCQNIYMHLFTNDRKYLDVAPAPNHTGSVTITVADKLERYGVSVLDVPTSTGSLIHMKWESALPNQAPSEFKDSLYLRDNTGPGTYTLKATVDEPSKPWINGCVFVLTITIIGGSAPPSPDAGGPGGPIDGGKMNILIYDSANRLLTSTADGVWEKEPARIEVIIDQEKIDSAFSTINTRINRAIEEKKAAFLAKYAGAEYEDVQVTSTPSQWNAKTNPATTWPSSFTLSVKGPGNNQSYQLQPKLQTQSNIYSGTVTPTLTTWQLTLLDADYHVTTENFTISVPYQVEFQVSYSQCEKNEEGAAEEKTCTLGTDSGSISGTFTILVQGDQTRFEVYEPNATGYLAHTAEWKEYQSRDRYPGNKENDFYAGERILTRVQLDAKHRHPYSNQFPTIQSAHAWISETGLRSTLLQSTLALQAASSTLWRGPNHQVPKLGTREMGVDTALMGDKQRGFKKGSSNAVYFQVQFSFNVSKGYSFPNKQTGSGHDQSDYRLPFMIIANAWERQGIRNHTSH